MYIFKSLIKNKLIPKDELLFDKLVETFPYIKETLIKSIVFLYNRLFMLIQIFGNLVVLILCVKTDFTGKVLLFMYLIKIENLYEQYELKTGNPLTRYNFSHFFSYRSMYQLNKIVTPLDIISLIAYVSVLFIKLIVKHRAESLFTFLLFLILFSLILNREIFILKGFVTCLLVVVLFLIKSSTTQFHVKMFYPINFTQIQEILMNFSYININTLFLFIFFLLFMLTLTSLLMKYSAKFRKKNNIKIDKYIHSKSILSYLNYTKSQTSSFFSNIPVNLLIIVVYLSFFSIGQKDFLLPILLSCLSCFQVKIFTQKNTVFFYSFTDSKERQLFDWNISQILQRYISKLLIVLNYHVLYICCLIYLSITLLVNNISITVVAFLFAFYLISILIPISDSQFWKYDYLYMKERGNIFLDVKLESIFLFCQMVLIFLIIGTKLSSVIINFSFLLSLFLFLYIGLLIFRLINTHIFLLKGVSEKNV